MDKARELDAIDVVTERLILACKVALEQVGQQVGGGFATGCKLLALSLYILVEFLHIILGLTRHVQIERNGRRYFGQHLLCHQILGGQCLRGDFHLDTGCISEKQLERGAAKGGVG